MHHGFPSKNRKSTNSSNSSFSIIYHGYVLYRDFVDSEHSVLGDMCLVPAGRRRDGCGVFETLKKIWVCISKVAQLNYSVVT